MSFELPDLRYAKDALEPHISAETMSVHHGKHHRKYVDKLNALIEGTDFESLSLREIVKRAADDADNRGVFNNAAQHWNHSFFWSSMTPENGGGGPADSALASQLTEAFGEIDNFKDEFVSAATGQFGSGWVWLVAQPDDGALAIETTANAGNPLTSGKVALLTCDVWEHAYYLDYKNRRADFVTAFVDHLANWEFAAENLAKAAETYDDADDQKRAATG